MPPFHVWPNQLNEGISRDAFCEVLTVIILYPILYSKYAYKIDTYTISPHNPDVIFIWIQLKYLSWKLIKILSLNVPAPYSYQYHLNPINSNHNNEPNNLLNEMKLYNRLVSHISFGSVHSKYKQNYEHKKIYLFTSISYDSSPSPWIYW